MNHLANLGLHLWRFSIVGVGETYISNVYDVDGKEIYTGDIVQYTREDKYRYIVTWNDELMCHEGKCIDNGCNVQFMKSFLEKCRVVGNVFDNPKLLKGVK